MFALGRRRCKKGTFELPGAAYPSYGTEGS